MSSRRTADCTGLWVGTIQFSQIRVAFRYSAWRNYAKLKTVELPFVPRWMVQKFFWGQRNPSMCNAYSIRILRWRLMIARLTRRLGRKRKHQCVARWVGQDAQNRHSKIPTMPCSESFRAVCIRTCANSRSIA